MREASVTEPAVPVEEEPEAASRRLSLRISCSVKGLKLAREMTKSLRRMIAPCAGVSALCSTGTQYDHHCCSSRNVDGGDLSLQKEWAGAAKHSSERGSVQQVAWKEVE